MSMMFHRVWVQKLKSIQWKAGSPRPPFWWYLPGKNCRDFLWLCSFSGRFPKIKSPCVFVHSWSDSPIPKNRQTIYYIITCCCCFFLGGGEAWCQRKTTDVSESSNCKHLEARTVLGILIQESLPQVSTILENSNDGCAGSWKVL